MFWDCCLSYIAALRCFLAHISVSFASIYWLLFFPFLLGLFILTEDVGIMFLLAVCHLLLPCVPVFLIFPSLLHRYSACFVFFLLSLFILTEEVAIMFLGLRIVLNCCLAFLSCLYPRLFCIYLLTVFILFPFLGPFKRSRNHVLRTLPVLSSRLAFLSVIHSASSASVTWLILHSFLVNSIY